MKIHYSLPVILLIASIISCLVTADLEEKNKLLPAKIEDDRGKETIEPVKKGEDGKLDKSDSRGQLDSKGGKDEQTKVNVGAQKDEPKENEGLIFKYKKESKDGKLLHVKEKCDSSSNRCMDDEKTFAACLRVPGSESPALSLLIENKGKDTLSITISAPDLVKLEKEKIELQGNKDAEVKVSIEGVENGHFIVLTAGHGNCSLNFKDQFVGIKKVDHSPDSSYFNISKLTLSTGFLFLAALLIGVVISVFMCAKLGGKYFARKGLKYQKLDMDLPISHGSKLESGENEGWDDNWGDSWDDEEAPTTPSLPLTPSLSSKGISSRKFKEGWKD
ncbi:hypothetical protein ACS0TY_011698 [Phlomoides rotata]